jgi:hypothetical protein
MIEISSVLWTQPSVFPTHVLTETDPVSETSCSLVPTIPDDGKVKKTSNSELFILKLKQMLFT